MNDLLTRKCAPCRSDAKPLTKPEVRHLLASVPLWKVAGKTLTRTFNFKNYHETMAFVNATAWISHRENHHPDLEVGYNQVVMRYSTHSVGGLSENDFICAAKISTLTAQ